MSYVDGFQRHVVPRLRRLADAQGTAIWEGTADFPAVHAGIMCEAIRLGACRLPDELFYQLSQWVSDRLVHAAQALDVRTDDDAWDWG